MNSVIHFISSRYIQIYAIQFFNGISDVHAVNDHCVLKHVIQHQFGVLKQYFHPQQIFEIDLNKLDARLFVS